MTNKSNFYFDKIEDNFKVEEFVFTPKTISYSGRTVQIRNVTRVFLYDVTRVIKVKYFLSWKRILRSLMYCVLFAILMMATFVVGQKLGEVNGNEEIFENSRVIFAGISFLFGSLFFIHGLLVLIGLIERMGKSDYTKRVFGIVIETSGGAENLVTKQRDFARKLFKQITIAMNTEEFRSIVANFRTGDINYVDTANIHTGDIFENIADSQIINRSVTEQI